MYYRRHTCQIRNCISLQFSLDGCLLSTSLISRLSPFGIEKPSLAVLTKFRGDIQSTFTRTAQHDEMSVHQCLEYVAIVTLTPWIDSLNTQRKLTAQDVPLFQQPRLTTLLLKLSSIEVFARAAVQPVPYDNLRTFRLSASKYPSAALDKFLKNAGKLRKFEFHHNAHARLIDTIPPNFSGLLQPCRNKLEILQLSWDCYEPLTFHGPGMAFGDFTAL